jgi:AcrR family transcriptional regulator
MTPDVASAISAIADAVEAEEGPMTEKKRRIVEAALACFAEQGYEATATSEIARRAGVAEATIFRHFATKKDLLLRLVRPVAARLLMPAALEELRRLKAETKGRFEEVAKGIMRSRLAFADRYGPFIRILVQELPLHPELRAALFSDAFRSGLAVLWREVASYQESGQIRDIPPERILRWFGAIIASYYVTRMFWPGPRNDEAEIEATVDFLLHGIAAGPR